MFKKLKKVVSGKGQRSADSLPSKAYAALSNSDTSSGDDSFYLPSASQPVKPITDQKTSAVLNQLVLNLGGDLGIMSLENENGYPSDENTVTSNTALQSCYITAIDGGDQTLRASNDKLTITDQSCASECDTLCVTALDNTYQVEHQTPDKFDKKPLPKDPLEDCLSALGGLSIASQASPSNALLSTVAENDNVRRLSDGSAFCVIDFDAEGQPVEHTLHYLPKASGNKINTENSDGNSSTVPVQKEENNIKTEQSGSEKAGKVNESLKVTKTNEVSAAGLGLETSYNNAAKDTITEKPVTNIAKEMCNSNKVETDDPDSDAAINSESYKDTLPNLVLPSALSNATSLDSTPFLTPEADITFSEFDPFSSKLVSDQTSPNAPLAQPDTDGDTPTSSGTLTSRATLEDNSLNFNPETPSSLSPDDDSFLHPGSVEENTPTIECSNIPSPPIVTKSVNIEDDLLSMFSGMKLEEKTGTPMKAKSSGPPESTDVGGSLFASVEQSQPRPVTVENMNNQADLFFEASGEFVDYNHEPVVEPTNQTPSVDGGIENEPKAGVKAVDNIPEKPKNNVLQEKQNLNTTTEMSPKFKSKKIEKQGPSPLIEEQESVVISKGSYTIDLNKFDDPKFDPFATKQTVGNSPTHEKDVEIVLENGDGPFIPVSNLEQSLPVSEHDSGDHTTHDKTSVEIGDSQNTSLQCKQSSIKDTVSENLPSDENVLEDEILTSKMGMLDKTGMLDGQNSSTAPETKINVHLADFDPLVASYQDDLPHIQPVLKTVVPNTQETQLLEDEKVDQQHDKENSLPPPRGAYTIDFDEPNFDPFQTKSAVSNNEPIMKVSIAETDYKDMQNVDNLMDSINAKTLNKDSINPDGDVLTCKNAASELIEEGTPMVSEFKAEGLHDSSHTTSLTEDTQSKSPEIQEKVETLLPKKGAYSVDFGKFDDPNFDPFQTTKALSNEDNRLTESTPVNVEVLDQQNSGTLIEELMPQVTKTPSPKENADMEDKLTSPQPQLRDETNVTEEISVPKGAYSFDLNKFDDPNFDPFKSGKGLSNESSAVLDTSARLSNGLSLDGKENINDNATTYDREPEPEVLVSREVKSQISPTEVLVDVLVSSEEPSKVQEPLFEVKSDVSNTDSSSFSQIKSTDTLLASELSVDNVIGTNAHPESTVTENTMQMLAQVVTEQDIDTDSPPASTGAYSIDYSKFDDPDFDPFKTNKGLSLDESAAKSEEVLPREISSVETDLSAGKTLLPEPDVAISPIQDMPSPEVNEVAAENDEPLPAKGAYSIDFDKFDDPNFDPFQTKTGVGGQTAVQPTNAEEKDKIPKKSPGKKVSGNKKKTNVKKSKPKVTEQVVETPDGETGDMSISKGSYSIDFSQFDDPNYDPFKTTKSLSNEGPILQEKVEIEETPSAVMSQDELDQKPVKEENTHLESAKPDTNAIAKDLQLADKEVGNQCNEAISAPKPNKKQVAKPWLKKKKKKTVEIAPSAEIGVEENQPPSKGAYSIDFSQFDDPNYDPFKTTKSLSNEGPTLQEQVEIEEMPQTEMDNMPNREENNQLKLEKPDKDASNKDLQSTDKKADNKSTESNSAAKPNKKQVPKPWLKKKKKKTVETAPSAEPGDEEDQPPPKGAYSIDFNQFDDPNFDPFITGKGLSNAEAPQVSIVTEPMPLPVAESADEKVPTSLKLEPTKQNQKEKKSPKAVDVQDDDNEDISPPNGAYSVDFSQFEDPNFDPFKTNKAISNDESSKIPADAEQTTTVDSTLEEKVKEAKTKRTTPKKSLKKKQKFVKKSPPPSEVGVDADDIPPPKGAYSIDFSQFDDPNYDPFKTGKGLSNEESSQVNAATESVPLPETESAAEKKSTPKKQSSKPKQKKKMTPKAADVQDDDNEDISPPKGAYSVDFSQFEDPNFDPFKTNKAISNDESSQLPADAEQTTVVDSAIEEKEANERTKAVVPKKSLKKKQKKFVKKSPPPSEVGVDADDISPPKGAYSIDFSQFDDPNYDPFKTNKGLSNDETTKPSEELNPPSTVRQTDDVDEAEVVADNNASPAKNTSNKKSKRVLKKAVPHDVTKEEDISVPKGGYTMDFSQFDDPNFDPFKSSKALENDPDGPTENTNIPTENDTTTEDTVLRNHLDDTLTQETLTGGGNDGDDDEFKPADEIFESEQNLTGWEELWKKQDDAPQESLLKKQSLYVQFDPLVQKRSLLDNMIAFDGEVEDGSNFPPQSSEIISENRRGIPEDTGNMTSYEPTHLHPAATRLTQNIFNEQEGSWNSIETPTANLLDLSLSPRVEGRPKTTYSAVRSEVESSGRRYTQEEYEELVSESTKNFDEENKQLKKLEADLLKRIEESNCINETASKEFKNKDSFYDAEVDAAESQHENSLKEFSSFVSMFGDYYRRNNKLMTTLIAHKKAYDDELQVKYKQKAALFKSTMTKYTSLKKEGDTAIARLNTEMRDVNGDAQRRASAMEARIKKEQMTVVSLEKQLENTLKENAELVKICDEATANMK